MKHTYQYPLEDGELPLWRMARIGAADLFDYPEEEPPSAIGTRFYYAHGCSLQER